MSRRIKQITNFNDIKREKVKELIGKEVEVRCFRTDPTFLPTEQQKQKQEYASGTVQPLENENQSWFTLLKDREVSTVSLFSLLEIRELTDR